MGQYKFSEVVCQGVETTLIYDIPFLFARQVGGLSALARPRSRRAETPPATTQQCVPGWGPSVSA